MPPNRLTGAATLACMGRSWHGLSVCSLMCISKEGRLCARGYPGQVSGDSLESQFFYMDTFPISDKYCHNGGRFATRWPFSMRWQVCLEDTGLPKTGCR